MPVNLTLGTKHLLNNYSDPFLLLYPIQSDESILRVETTGTDYQNILNQNFDWHFTYYKFIYLNFNQEQTSFFFNKYVNKKQSLQDFNVLALNETKNPNNFVMILGSNEKTDYSPLINELATIATNDLGIFTKDYIKKQDNDKNNI